MKEFGWTIEYVLSLTFPVFLNLFGLITRCRFDSAIDEFYTPYGAAKYGGKAQHHLFNVRGDIFIGHEPEDVTPEMIERANAKLRKVMEKYQGKLEETLV